MKAPIIKTQRGDVSLFIVLTMITIMYFILFTISQKTVRDIQIGRESLNSQQAVQAANIGIEQWMFNFTEGFTGDIPATQVTIGGVNMNYEVQFDPVAGTVTSIGRVTSNNRTITRSLKMTF